MRSLAVCAAVLAAVVLPAVWTEAGPARAAEPEAAKPAAARPPAAPVPPSPQELSARKFEKLVASARDKMNDFQKEEFQLEMASIKGEGTALQAVKDPKKATEQIAKNAMTPELKVYRDVVLAAAGKWREFQQRYLSIGRTVATLEKERANVPAGLQATIDELAAKFNQKNRSLQLKIMEFYERAADYRSAIAVATAVYQEIPEDKRAGERALKENIADLYSKVGDNASALAAYKSILDARPEKDRYKDAKLCEKVGDLHKATGDFKAALDMYKHALSALGGGKPGKDGKPNKATEGLQKKIADLEKKVGTPPPTQAPAPAPAK
jgi:tetratricopeptide (TPR) repeat protein